MRCLYTFFIILFLGGCAGKKERSMDEEKIKLMVLAPGHFHASLVQKTMYPGIDSTVYVYAPEGMEVEDYLARVESYNEREEDPTGWKTETYLGKNFLTRMLNEKPGDLVVLAGNNKNKTEYIADCVDAGLHVYSDKPMAIDTSDFNLLKATLQKADEQDLLLYDIMTERFEITTILQKRLSENKEVFGGMVDGTPEEPAITKESVHHFFKYVSGKPLQRPAWFFDVTQEGEAIADVGTHLVDLVLWEAFPDNVPDYKKDVEILQSLRWPTPLDIVQFEQVTGKNTFPSYLAPYVTNDTLYAVSNSSVDLRIRGKHAKVSVEWAFQAPEGAGDTHYSIMRGHNCDLIIRQGEQENYRPELYVEAHANSEIASLSAALENALKEDLQVQWPGLSIVNKEAGLWRINIPEIYREGHEAHFARVTGQFLEYMEQGHIPEWELEQMLTKYYITTMAVANAIDR